MLDRRSAANGLWYKENGAYNTKTVAKKRVMDKKMDVEGRGDEKWGCMHCQKQYRTWRAESRTTNPRRSITADPLTLRHDGHGQPCRLVRGNNHTKQQLLGRTSQLQSIP